MINDLYNKRYILYVNNYINSQPKELVEQIIFHEFTHVYDSLIFIKYEVTDFKKLMNIYSETHASEIMMDKLIKTQKVKPYSLNGLVTYNICLPLESFMNQTYDFLKQEFIFNKTNILQCGYNYKKFYYYVGYIISLHKNNINYMYNFDDIDKDLADLFYIIIKSFLSHNYDVNSLIQYEDSLKELVLYKIKENMGLV